MRYVAANVADDIALEYQAYCVVLNRYMCRGEPQLGKLRVEYWKREFVHQSPL